MLIAVCEVEAYKGCDAESAVKYRLGLILWIRDVILPRLLSLSRQQPDALLTGCVDQIGGVVARVVINETGDKRDSLRLRQL
jgi:hypothetical protein